MNENQRKELIRQTFNTVAPGYDRAALRFFPESAAHLVSRLQLAGDEHVLDVATGTGAVAMNLAHCLPRGRVTGIDMSDGMLRQAAGKAEGRGLGNVAFQVMDMTDLSFPPEHFHCATAAFALFFVEDMAACLRGIVERLKPGGQVLVSGFAEGSFSPNVDLFLARIQSYGVEPPPLSWKRLSNEALNHALLAAAGLKDIQVTRRDLSYPLADAEGWWEVLWHAGFRSLLGQLSATDLERFRTEHLAEITALDQGGGVPLRIEVLYAHGRKPG
ncbi:MAG: methyltransferase domain-containing protein [Betaproteobacteria bacterium]|nr:methyltransferase domain-containing protein [Betaproteobacteria bacterium]